MISQTSPSRLSRSSAVKIIILCLLAGLFSVAFAEDWDGSTSKPSSKEIDGIEYYVITSPEELAWFAYQVNENDKKKINAVLGNDIHFSDDENAICATFWSAIGISESKAYDGVFDGAGYAVYGLYSKSTMFGYTGENFVLKNISIKKSDVVTWVGFNKGLIIDCVEDNEDSKQIAGFVYTNYGTIKNCLSKNFNIAEINRGIVDSCKSVGAGNVYSSTYSNGSFSVIKKSSNRGGIVYDNYGTIKNSSFLPIKHIVMDGGYFGGIAYSSYENSLVENCRFEGNVVYSNSDKPFVNFGGIVARARYNSKIKNCQVKVDSLILTYLQQSAVGGIAGIATTLGDAEHKGFISNSFASVNIVSMENMTYLTYPNRIGGIVGLNQYYDIENVHAIITLKKSLNSKKNENQMAALVGYMYRGSLKNSYGIIVSNVKDTLYKFAGIVSTAESSSNLSNSYYDKDLSTPDTMHAVQNLDGTSTSVNVSGKTTAVMQSPAFVETLNTNAGLDDDSGIWQYCEGNYPILVTEGTCEEFYSKYGFSSSLQSSSSSAESSSSVSSSSVESSSSQAPSSSSEKSSSSSKEESSSSVAPPSSSSEKQSSSSVVPSSSSAKQESSSSNAKSSSSEKSSSSSAKSSSSSVKSSSSKAKSSSSQMSDFVMATPQKNFNLAVNGMTVTLSNTHGGNVRIFDALGHLVVAKPLSATGATNVTLQTSGNYIVRVNGSSQSVTLR